MPSDPWVGMGFVRGAFGVRGWLKVVSHTTVAADLLRYPQWRLERGDHIGTFRVQDGSVHGAFLHVQLEGITSREQAHDWRAHTISVPRSALAECTEDEYYWVDLLGLQVYNLRGLELGRVHTLIETGAHDVLVVHGPLGEIMIPFVKRYVHTVSVSQQRIDVNWDV